MTLDRKIGLCLIFYIQPDQSEASQVRVKIITPSSAQLLLSVDKKDENCVEGEDLRRGLRYDPNSMTGSG